LSSRLAPRNDALFNCLTIGPCKRPSSPNAGPKDRYYLTFKAPGGTLLQRGTYDNAISHPYSVKDKPGLDFSGNGSGCDTVDGRFTVHEIVFNSANQVEMLDITFERRCGSSTTVAYGRVRYDRRDRRQ
jgi:hypothetical protein